MRGYCHVGTMEWVRSFALGVAAELRACQEDLAWAKGDDAFIVAEKSEKFIIGWGDRIEAEALHLGASKRQAHQLRLTFMGRCKAHAQALQQVA